MNLFDCRVPFIRLPDSVLQLGRKVEVITAINLYRHYSPIRPLRISIREDRASEYESPFRVTPYQRRQRAETLHALERAGVLQQGQTEGTLELLPVHDTSDVQRINIPAEYDYANLSCVALKTLLACHAHSRYQRKSDSFRLTITYKALAGKAGISVRRLADGLAELERTRFLSVWSHRKRRQWMKEQREKAKQQGNVPGRKKAKKRPWKDGVMLTLREPNSDTPLTDLGHYIQKQIDLTTPLQRYIRLLAQFDPKGQLANVIGPAVRGYHVNCPFCKREKLFTFTADEDQDIWRCFGCNRRGTSYSLWAKLGLWKVELNWQQMLATSTAPVQVNDEQEHPESQEKCMRSFAQLEQMSASCIADHGD